MACSSPLSPALASTAARLARPSRPSERTSASSRPPPPRSNMASAPASAAVPTPLPGATLSGTSGPTRRPARCTSSPTASSTVRGLAASRARLGYEQRQVRRLLTEELGASPLAIARAQRAQTARTLMDEADPDAGGRHSLRGWLLQHQAVEHDHRQGTHADADPAAHAGPGRRSPGTPRPSSRGLPSHRAPLVGCGWPTRAPIDTEGADAGFPGRPGRPPGWRLDSGKDQVTANHPAAERNRDLWPWAPSCPPSRPERAPDRAMSTASSRKQDLRDLTAAVPITCSRLLNLDEDPEAVTGYLAADPVLGPLVSIGKPVTFVARPRGRQRAGAAGRTRPAGVGGHEPGSLGTG